MSDLNREAIYWATKNGHERVVFVDGERRVERVPQRGHQGDYEDRRPARGIRSFLMVRDDGHAVHMVMTCAAAHMDHTTPFGQYQMAKARHLGWFRLGACPCALIATGELRREQLADKTARTDRPCEPGSYSEAKPCPHAKAELEARRGKHAAAEARKNANFKDSTDKIVEAQAEQTEKLIGALADALGKGRPAK